MRARLVVVIGLVAVGLLAVALAAAAPARADWDDRPDPSEVDEELSSQGYWVDDPSYGHVWRPSVDWEWRPYVDGHWAWTTYGWTWVSEEPWSWTFHYGRWAWLPAHAWVWVPGDVWGPAWVDWYWGDGYVGWVPLGPPGFDVAPGYWTYVEEAHFCAPRVATVVVVDRDVPDFIVHHRDEGWGRRKPPGLRDIEVVSGERVERLPDRPRESIAPWMHKRLEGGGRVRERIADQGGERVVEHGGPTPDQKKPLRPDDEWRRRLGPRAFGGAYYARPEGARGPGREGRGDEGRERGAEAPGGWRHGGAGAAVEPRGPGHEPEIVPPLGQRVPGAPPPGRPMEHGTGGGRTGGEGHGASGHGGDGGHGGEHGGAAGHGDGASGGAGAAGGQPGR